MTRHDRPIVPADRRRVQRSALGVGLWVGVTSAAIVIAISVITVTVSSLSSRPGPGRGGGGGGGGNRVLDLEDVVVPVVVLGVLGVLALSVTAWWVARRAALPLAEALQAQRAFVADASHELRTPLTTLTSRIQVAQHRAERGGDVVGALKSLRRDAAVMDTVLTDMLLAAEAAGTGAAITAASARLDAAAREAVTTIEPRATEANVRLHLDVPGQIVVGAEHAAVSRALTALLDNAVRHSPSGGAVRITARQLGRQVEIRVADEGGGISGVDPNRVFDRFTRASTSGPQRGFGLGLALVRDVVARYSGSVTVERTSSQGTTFLLRLPGHGRTPR
ncbi:HAMP domain-containing sensor histidine kinase [Microbacterium oryzae]|uniref:sensor histidine kinase n=1 Tax=Microbacterium oryzae TaxID=743009 RepID=UPI0025B02025|nr:HAMP domain-containing sensor histidine kinase [Microbacterium oryzae]MDN3310698.1 HAMP domain-containing sensor histidine kinase [Microbacterium oryzae]